MRNHNCCKLLYWETKQQPLKVLETGLAASPSNSALSVYIQERIEKSWSTQKRVQKRVFQTEKEHKVETVPLCVIWGVDKIHTDTHKDTRYSLGNPQEHHTQDRPSTVIDGKCPEASGLWKPERARLFQGDEFKKPDCGIGTYGDVNLYTPSGWVLPHLGIWSQWSWF